VGIIAGLVMGVFL